MADISLPPDLSNPAAAASLIADAAKLAALPSAAQYAIDMGAKQDVARTVRSVDGATDTLLVTDTEALGVLYVRYTAAGGCAVGLEKHATTAYPIPCAISVRTSAAGDVVITPVSPATINGAGTAVTVPSGTAATLVQPAEDVWETIPTL